MTEQQTFYERTFTDEEQDVLTRALLAYRRGASNRQLDVIDGILRDGWDTINVPAGVNPEQLELPFDPNDTISVRFADREAWLREHGYPQPGDADYVKPKDVR